MKRESMFSLLLCLCMLCCCSKVRAYHKGRLGGAGPSAEYLRENSHILRHSRKARPTRCYGNGEYTPQNYRKAIYDGDVYWGGKAYGWSYPTGGKMPTICTNKTANGMIYKHTKLGYFVCPMSHEAETMVYCCGEEEREYCCDTMTSKIFYYVERTSKDDLKDIGIVFAILGGIFLPFIIPICVYFLCCRNR